MKIDFFTNYIVKPHTNTPQNPQYSLKSLYATLPCDTVCFEGKNKKKPQQNKEPQKQPNKRIDVDLEKKKLLAKITKIQDTYPKEVSNDTLFFAAVRHFSNIVDKIPDDLKPSTYMYIDEDNVLYEVKNDNPATINTVLSDEQYATLSNAYDELNRTRKQILKLEKEYKRSQTQNKEIPPPKYDYVLMNKFKSALLDDNFDLRGIYLEHYNVLNEIKTVKQLKAKFPHIQLPKDPRVVVSKKIEETLGKEFYQNLDYIYSSDKKEGHKFIDDKVKENISLLAEKYNLDEENLYKKIHLPARKFILDKYKASKEKNVINSIPEKKNVKLQITDNDIELLKVNYNDFVLSTIRKQYLNFEKLNDIVYENKSISIPISKIKDPAYKFEKLSELLKSFIADSEKIQYGQRDYVNFNTNDFKNRLLFYLDGEISTNQEIFDSLFAFYTSKFTAGDIEPLINLLRKMDSIADGEISTDEAIKQIKAENIKPTGTQSLIAKERKELEDQIKLEQKQLEQLAKTKAVFDRTMNILHFNNLSSLADNYFKYRPTSIENDNPETIDKITNIVKSYIVQDDKIEDISGVKKSLSYFDTYLDYKSKDSNSPIFKNALKYATDENGNLDEVKAGHYLTLFDIVECSNYGTFDFYEYPEILSKLKERTTNIKSIVEYLCKYEDFKSLPLNERASIKNITKNFSLKDSTEKMLLKNIIETDYINCDTTYNTKISRKNDISIPATIKAEAKQAILDYYKFPNCIEYFEDFEDALTHFAAKFGTSGIKVFSDSKYSDYTMELKIADSPDRLLSSKNDYVFDIFAKDGLH